MDFSRGLAGAFSTKDTLPAMISFVTVSSDLQQTSLRVLRRSCPRTGSASASAQRCCRCLRLRWFHGAIRRYRAGALCIAGAPETENHALPL